MTFVILPYAVLSRPLTIRGITFRSSEDLAGVEDAAATHLKTLFKLFFLRDTLRFKRMAYHYCPDEEPSKRTAFLRKLWESSICLKYICTNPSPPRSPAPTFAGLSDYPATEVASVYVFAPCNLTTSHYLPLNPQENVEYVGSEPESSYHKILHGYSGWMLGRGNPFSIGPSGRIYPPGFALESHLIFRYGINIGSCFDALTHGSKWAIRGFMESQSDGLTDLEKRILKAMDWYNQSCEQGIHPFRSLVFLAIAFEALLNLKWEQRNTERFKDVVMTLLGSVDRLNTWLDQFFDARGAIVHTGEAEHVFYYPPDDRAQSHKKALKTETPISLLTHQGRMIFHLCLDAILSSSVTAHEANLSSQFTHDEERINSIKGMLDRKDGDLAQRIISTRQVVLELTGNIYQTSSRVKPGSLLKLTAKMMKLFLGAKLHEGVGVPASIVAQMTAFVTEMKEYDPGKDDSKLMIKQLHEMNRAIGTWYSESLGLGGTPRNDEAFEILRSLMNYAVEYLYGFA
jgi:hypothetical protein